MDMLAGKVKMTQTSVNTAMNPTDMLERPIRLHAKDVTVHYGAKQALFGISIDIPDRAVTSFIGPSGCGKSTFLRCINRMNDTIEGAKVGGLIELDGENIYDPVPGRRGTARPHRHGVPEAKSVPEVDLRERRLWPQDPRPGPLQGRSG